MNQAAIDPSLANLLNLSAAVQQTANPVVPATGQPTVASQMAQQAQKMAQPQQAPQPPAGIENLLPGVGVQAAQMAQQPATQAQMMAAQQQMQQQMQQMQQMAQQRRPRGMASGGIASLPVDVEMAEGGVVGYAGPEGSYVTPRTYGYAPDYEDARRLGIDLSPYDPPEVRREKLERLAKMREFDEQRKSFGEIPTEASVARDRTIEMAYANPSRGRETPTEMAYAHPSRSRDINRSALPAPRPPQAQPSPTPRPPVQTAPPEATGVATLMGPPVPSGSERQFGEALTALGRVETPKERSAQEFAAEREALYRLRGIDPDFAKQRLERLQQMEARDQEEAAARAKMVKERGLENLISRLSRFSGPTLFSGAAQAQLGMEPIVAAQRQSDESFNLLMRNRQIAANQERSAIEDMQRALADGDIAKAEKSRDTALAARNARATAEADLRSRFAPQMLHAETAAADRASRVSEGALDRATRVSEGALDRASRERIEGARLQQQAEINGQTKLAGALNAANITVSAAFEKMDRDLEKRFGATVKMYQIMSPADIAKDPRLASGYQQYLKEREVIYKGSVEPAIAHRDRLASQIMSGGVGDLKQWGELKVKQGG